MRMTVCLIACCFCLLVACAQQPPKPEPAPETPEAPTPAPQPAPEVSDQDVLTAASEYLQWHRVADYPQWAPTMCMLPTANTPFLSEASTGPHERKLYYLYVKDAAAYEQHTQIQPTGQVLVKDSFHPVESEERGRKIYRTGERQGLFVMYKADTGETDNGWIYATLTADGKQVTSKGLIDSCMGCHADAGESRLFGVQADMYKEGKPRIYPPEATGE
jgi:hypothetical protein